MNSKQIKEWIGAIRNEDGKFMSDGSLRTLKMIEDEINKPGYAAAPQKGMDIREKYKQWCKETKRNGSVLVGGSMQEFFNWLDESPSPSEAGDGWISVSSLKKLITNMKDKNFLESVIIEEVERNLDNPERLHKVFPPSNP